VTEPVETEGLRFVRSLIDSRQPLSPMAELFRTAVTDASAGAVTLASRPDANANSRRGSIHGGVVCTLLDTAMVLAAVTCLERVGDFSTVDLSVHFMRSAPAGDRVFTTYAEVLRPGSRITFVQGRCEDDAGRVLATATGSVLVG
jgi:uncharacterized protein (TIGR00369 family)